MTEEADQERLERLRGDLTDVRARATAVSAAEAASGDQEDRSVTSTEPSRPEATLSDDDVPRSYSARASRRRRPVSLPDVDRPVRQASRDGETRDAPTGILGRPRIPRPPRRNPLRRKAHRPPRRLAVPVPIPVTPRPRWMAAPRFPTITWAAGVLIFVILAPAVGQLAWRLMVAMARTSALMGADPTRSDMLQAAAGVAGGGITLTIALVALAIVRGRVGYVAAAGCVALFFVAFPYMAYTANAGIVSAPVPTWQEMLRPVGWPRLAELQTAFVITVTGLVLAVGDLVQRSASALRHVSDGT